MNHSKRLFVIALLVILALNIPALPSAAQDATTPPLSEKGPYGVDLVQMTFVDDSREGRELETLIWYPAEAGKSSYWMPEYQAKPDLSAVPYPLVFYSHYLHTDAGSNFSIAPHLASYGFVAVSIWHQDPEPAWPNLIHRPLDILFVLDQLAAMTEGDLIGVINTDVVGVTGYSAGGRTALMLNGSYLDPEYMLNWCAENEPAELAGPPPDHTAPGSLCLNYGSRWDEITAFRALYASPLVEGEPWPPFTDPRIRAVMPMAVCGMTLWGEQGLAASAVPTLILLPESDDVCPAQDNADMVRRAFLDVPDRYLLTLLGINHSDAMVESTDVPLIFRHFETAFFGYYLQGNADYAQYLTPESVVSLGSMTLEVGGE